MHVVQIVRTAANKKEVRHRPVVPANRRFLQRAAGKTLSRKINAGFFRWSAYVHVNPEEFRP
jgi:hypothetical protein